MIKSKLDGKKQNKNNCGGRKKVTANHVFTRVQAANLIGSKWDRTSHSKPCFYMYEYKSQQTCREKVGHSTG